MIKIYLVLLGSILLWSCNPDDRGVVVDDRDERVYEWVRIGDLKWFRSNLAYLPRINLVSEQSDTVAMFYVYGNGSESTEDARNQQIRGAVREAPFSSYEEYGVLYNHAAILNPKSLCPEGWRVPSDGDWKKLEIDLGMDPDVVNLLGHRHEGKLGHLLKDSTGWGNNGNGMDAYRLTIKPAGECFSGSNYHSEATSAVFWTSTTDEFGNATVRKFSCCNTGIVRDWADRRDGYSVRCVQ